MNPQSNQSSRKKSKAFYAFEQRIMYFDDDLELMDIIGISVKKGLLSSPNQNTIFTMLNENLHSHIARRSNSNNSRKAVILHLKQTLYSSYIKDLYEEFSLYLKTILQNVAISCKDNSIVNPERIIGKNLKSSFTAEQLLNCGSWKNVVDLIIDTLFQSLESEQSTKKLIMQFNKKLDIDIDEGLINDVMPYLDTRHILVHSDGKPNEDFLNRYTSITIDINGYIKLSMIFCKEMKEKLLLLSQKIDEQIVTKGILLDKYCYIPIPPQNKTVKKTHTNHKKRFFKNKKSRYKSNKNR